jgi:hypothetical protein
MKKISNLYQQLNEDKLILILTLLGALLAWRIIYIQQGWVNVDSLIYFEAARLFSIGEWKQGIATFAWPLYSVLISAVQRLTHLGIQTSAQLLDIVFFAITTFSFTKLIQLAGGNKLTILCGTFLLFSSSYIVGDILPMLLRDQGFWAAFLTSLVFFIQFYRRKRLSNALLWQVSAIIAMLFRIEAITFLVCLPILLMFKSEYSLKEKVKQIAIINAIPILSVLLIIGALITIPSVTLSDFGRIQEVVSIIYDISNTFSDKAALMGNVLGNYFADYGLIGLVATLLSILVLKMINLIGWPIIGLYALNHVNKDARAPTWQMQTDTRIIFYSVITLAIINACAILARVFILSNRYIIAIGFIALIFAAFCLAPLITSLRTNRFSDQWQKWLTILLVVIFSLSFIKNILPKKEGYNFEQDAVAYVKQQQIPNDKVFFVTDKSIYYAGAKYTARRSDHWQLIKNAIDDGTIYKYNCLMLYVEVDESLTEKEKVFADKLAQYNLEKEFYGVNGKKKIMLYVKNSALR